MQGSIPKHTVFVERKIAKFRLTDAPYVLQYGLEHRLQTVRTTANDSEYVRRRRLLLERLAQLVEQACILDRNHRLPGEVADQLDLLVGERAHLLAIDPERADQVVVLEQRHAQKGPRPSELHKRACGTTPPDS